MGGGCATAHLLAPKALGPENEHFFREFACVDWGRYPKTNQPPRRSVKIPHSASPSLSLLPTWPKPGEGCGDGGFCICQKQPRSCSFPLGFTEKYCDPHLRFIKVVKRRDFLKPKGPLHAVQPVSTFSQPNRKNSRQDK